MFCRFNFCNGVQVLGVLLLCLFHHGIQIFILTNEVAQNIFQRAFKLLVLILFITLQSNDIQSIFKVSGSCYLIFRKFKLLCKNTILLGSVHVVFNIQNREIGPGLKLNFNINYEATLVLSL
jgi:hypothetical protein